MIRNVVKFLLGFETRKRVSFDFWPFGFPRQQIICNHGVFSRFHCSVLNWLPLLETASTPAFISIRQSSYDATRNRGELDRSKWLTHTVFNLVCSVLGSRRFKIQVYLGINQCRNLGAISLRVFLGSLNFLSRLAPTISPNSEDNSSQFYENYRRRTSSLIRLHVFCQRTSGRSYTYVDRQETVSVFWFEKWKVRCTSRQSGLKKNELAGLKMWSSTLDAL